MKQYYLRITSKNEKSLKSFLNFFSKYSKTQFNVLSKSTSKKKKKKFFSLLKSPHVNKTAQEQFEFRTFSAKISIVTSSPNKNLLFLKKLTNRLFHDISINVELCTNPFFLQKNQLVFFCPDNFRFLCRRYSLFNYKRRTQAQLSNRLKIKKGKLSNLTKFLKIFDVFGEILIKNSRTF